MDFYTLPVIINNRREVVTQLNQHGVYSENRTYVIETLDCVHFPLLSIHKNFIFKTFIENTPDYYLSELEPSCYCENNRIFITFKLREEKKEAKEQQETKRPEPLNYEDLEDFYFEEKSTDSLSDVEQNNQQYEEFEISKDLTIQFKVNALGSILIGAKFTGNDLKTFSESESSNFNIFIQLDVPSLKVDSKISLSLSAPENFLGMALDFGSESSQLAIKRYENNTPPLKRNIEMDNLFKRIVNYQISKGWVERDLSIQYYQEEPGTNFYKSLFFLKEQLTGDYVHFDDIDYIVDIQSDLKMLVNTHDGMTQLNQQRFQQLPNLKITHQHNEELKPIFFDYFKGNEPVDVQLHEIKYKVYNSILKVMIGACLQREFNRYNHAKRKIRFTILVPNIYDLYDIKKTQESIHKIFEDFASAEFKDEILAWEVLTISESDAALLGFVDKMESDIQKNKNYIIIDSGKGTTDFSIIRTGKNNAMSINPIYRNGFAGAGNLITYAVFETVLHYIRAHAEFDNSAFKFIRDKVIAVLESHDLERKNLFYNELERLKFNYNDNATEIIKQWDSAKIGDITFENLTKIDGLDISALTDLLKDIEQISDFYGYIQDACNLIAYRVVGNLKLVAEHQKNFDCTGVLLTGRAFLFQPLIDAIQLQMKEQLQIPAQKIHVLQGNELKNISLKGVFNQSIRINSDVVGFPIQVIIKNQQEQSASLEEEKEEKPKQSLQSRFLNLLFNDMDKIQKADDVRINHSQLAVDQLFQSQLLIGSGRYKVLDIAFQQDFIHNNLVESDIVFTPQEYLVRVKSNHLLRAVLPLDRKEDDKQRELSVIIPSLFPNYIHDRYLYSLQRSDIVKQKSKPKGPMYF